mgnify:FL=1
MKRVAPLFVALVLSVVLALVAYRVAVHYATVPTGDAPEVPVPAPADRPDPLPMETTPLGPAPLPPEQARAADAIERARPIQQAVDQFYAREGTWPRNLAQLGLGYPDDHEGGPVAAISVHPFGEVAIAMKPHVARGGVIRLSPTVQADGTLVWNCRASNYAAATKLSSCR